MKHPQLISKLFFFGLVISSIWMYIPDNTNALPLHTNPAVRATNDMSLFYWFVAIIGGLIAITLTYVSYRKYKGEQKKREKDKEQNS